MGRRSQTRSDVSAAVRANPVVSGCGRSTMTRSPQVGRTRLRAPRATCCALVATLCLWAPGCDAPAEPSGATSGPSSSGTPSPPSASPVLVPRAPVTRIDISALPVTSFDADIAALPDGPPSVIPWAEFKGSSELGHLEVLHVGARRLPLGDFEFLREVAVWDTGMVWYGDYGLRFMGWDGRIVRVKNFPAWYERVAFGSNRAYTVKQRVVWSVSARDLVRHEVVHAADVAGIDRDDPSLRASLRGVLDGDDPVLRLSHKIDGTRRADFYSLRRGLLPLRPDWSYWHSPTGVTVGIDPTRRILAAYDSDDFRPLWTHTFRDGQRPLRFYDVEFTPGGRRLILRRDRGRSVDAVIVHASSGRPARLVRMPHFDFQFEDDHHFVYPVYDGPPNPFYDPRDPFPEVSELDWPNVLVRCSLGGVCERVARVDAPERSLTIGDQTYLSAS